MTNNLVVEDEKKVSALIQQGLQEKGFAVDTADTPGLARQMIGSKKYDLLILDVMLPEMSGIEFTRELRKSSNSMFILMLTALSTTKDKIQGLDSGADDYLPKPFEFEELHARVKALIRRRSGDNSQLKNGDLLMDLITRNVRRGNQNIELTTKEFALLEFLLRNVDKIVDRSSIAQHVWGAEFDPDSNVIDVYINHLRKKIDSPFPQKLLKTVVGQGYVLNKID